MIKQQQTTFNGKFTFIFLIRDKTTTNEHIYHLLDYLYQISLSNLSVLSKQDYQMKIFGL